MHTANGKTRFLYRTSERAHALLLVDGEKVVRTYSTNRRGKFDWYGELEGQRLALVAEDLAGNRSEPVPVTH